MRSRLRALDGIMRRGSHRPILLFQSLETGYQPPTTKPLSTSCTSIHESWSPSTLSKIPTFLDLIYEGYLRTVYGTTGRPVVVVYLLET